MSVVINGTSGITFPNGVTMAAGTSSPVTAAQGGTGLTSPGTSGYVLTSNGTGWVSSALPASGVTSVATSGGVTGGTITSTGTISIDTNNNLGIGSTQMLVCTYGTNIFPGTTISGSYLYYMSSLGSSMNAQTVSRNFIASSNVVNGTAASYTYSSGVNAVTFTQAGGTWRALSGCPKATYTACASTYCSEVLFIRVS